VQFNGVEAYVDSEPTEVAMFFVMLPPIARIRLDELKTAARNMRPTAITLAGPHPPRACRARFAT
jgi:ACR3 family arsenite efflux pump ArsB